jgi:hypothetical protein
MLPASHFQGCSRVGTEGYLRLYRQIISDSLPITFVMSPSLPDCAA